MPYFQLLHLAHIKQALEQEGVQRVALEGRCRARVATHATTLGLGGVVVEGRVACREQISKTIRAN